MIEWKDHLIHFLGGHTEKEWVANNLEYEAKIDSVIIETGDRIKTINAKHAEQLKTAISVTATPEGCKRGAWCAGCAFGKKFTARVGTPYEGTSYSTYACTKDEGCQNFTPREEAPHEQ